MVWANWGGRGAHGSSGSDSSTIWYLLQANIGRRRLDPSRCKGQLRLTEAVCQLSLGQSVNSVARDMGYATANAFSTMFRRTPGEPPQRYLRAAIR
nr:helix-turn-helix domain-containing protein [Candidimonas nitroreducens]